MIRQLLAGAVVAATLSASPAHADHEVFDCGMDTAAQGSLTGGSFTGTAYGYLVAGPGQHVTLRCYVTVDGVEVASVEGAGVSAAVAYGSIAYTADDTQIVIECTAWTVTNADGSPHDSGDQCGWTDPGTLPPQEVIDVLDQVFDLIADGGDPPDLLFCSVFKTLGTPGLVNVGTPVHGWSMDADDCDLYYAGERFVDFMPYDD